MASDKEYLEFVIDQLSQLPGVSYRAMMGEFVIYYRGKVVGGIFDNRLLVKQTKTARELMPSAPLELPYEGGKEMLLVEDVDDRDFLCRLLTEAFDELPEPKTKNR